MALGGDGGGKSTTQGALKAGETFVEVSADDSKFQTVIKNVANKLHSFGGTVRNIGLSVGAAGAAITAPLTGLFYKAIEYGKGVAVAAKKAQASAEAISSLTEVASLDDLVTINGRLTKSAVAAAQGSKEQADAFEKMGISANDFLALDIDQRFLKVAETASTLGTPLEQNSFLLAILGRSAIEFGSKFTGGVEKIKEKIEEARAAGGIVNQKDADDSLKTLKAMEFIGKAIKFTWLEVGFALLGFKGNIQEGALVVGKFLEQMREFIRANRQTIATVFTVGLALVTAGTAFAFVGLAIQGLVTTLATLSAVGMGVLGALFSPLAVKIYLVAAAAIGLYQILRNVFGLLTAFDGISGDFNSAMEGMVTTFLSAWAGITSALKAGEFRLAGQIAMQSLVVAWQEGIVLLTRIWIRFKASFVDGWHDIGYSISLLWNDFTSGLKSVFINMTTSIIYAMTWLTRQLAVGAARAAGILDKIDPTGAAKAAQDWINQQVAGIDDFMNTIVQGRDAALQEIEQDRQRGQNKILDRAKAEKQERDKFREQEVLDQLNELAAMKKRLADLVTMAMGLGKTPGPEIAPMPRAKEMPKNMEKLADATRGLFTSRDYRGALGLGPASDEAKAQTLLQRDMLKELKEIRKKTGNPVFD